MKSKSIYLSNFKYKKSISQDNFNSLTIDRLVNTKTNNGCIQTLFSENDILDVIFDSNTVLNIKSLNSEILKSITKIIPYEYFDSINTSKHLRLFAISNDNKLFELNMENLLLNHCYTFLSQPKIILSNNTIYFFDSNDKCVLIEDKNLLTIENIPLIKTFAFDDTHLYFVLENHPNKLFISEKCELKNISSNISQYECILITIEDGLIENVFCLKNNIYIFTNYSILKLDLTNNHLIKQNRLNLFIYKNSTKQVDDSIYFYSTNGLYIFDGIDINQIFDNKLNLSNNADFVYFNHKLYIFDLKFKEIIFKYNFSNDSFCEIKINNLINFYKICSLSNYFFVTCKNINDSNQISILNFDLSSKTFPYQSVVFKPTFLGSNTLKKINHIYINSEGDFQLKISSEISSTNIKISDSNSKFNVDLSGTFFNFEILSNSYFKLNSILISFSEIGD